ncbi:hypothetical protein [Rhodocyclus tenuis]|uniref:Uncharacterized protein n=1 Tax=Rhodocyclus tenuis TaxID=1066 RepID=A0A840G2F7_RHOTE|nr:hypothetical protein [Rhodocyclus tenuis]MBB4248577.1 hypothetical protein [Rhodocyclus tenuis]
MKFLLKRLSGFLLLVLLVAGSPAIAGDDIREERLRLDQRGEAVVAGRIRGWDSVDYLVQAGAGQVLTVVFKASRGSAYFNVLPPASEEALFVGSQLGDRFSASLTTAGEYRIRVYLMRNAARRNESASYTLRTTLTVAPAPALFDKTLELQGIRFHVTSFRAGAGSIVRVLPAGLSIDNSAQERAIDGLVSGAEVADLNADGSPEIYIYIRSVDADARGSLVAFSANRRKSLSDIHLPPLADHAQAAAGYQGNDEFAVLEGVLGRRFPLTGNGGRHDGSGASSAVTMRQIQYRLLPGEVGWRLSIDRLFEF